ncbi:S8 family peptidase [Thioalkalivibrio sp. HK1]|uniref:S8 family peptidase n=1 Tax=Thioalkalivibrio sp. HK1 TaxID=1469245 RepID=UPI0004703EE9|nr:S8 family peptidase [Thioalkalivibrio sp. HK1]
MADRPLLLFPTPVTADRSRRRSGFPNIHKPSIDRQGQRLSPIFTRLQTEFNERRVELQQTAAGAEPEQVLVIETVGSVENFANAVKRIAGLEWMDELDTDEIVPDEDFYNEQNADKELSGRLYFVMTNQQALREMLSLWKRYQVDPSMTFEHGLTKFRDVFRHLKDIRRWGVQDRIKETGALDIWCEDLKYDGGRAIRFEIELWFRGADDKRQEAQKQVQALIEGLGGSLLRNCTIPNIAYHALLAEIPANAAQQIIDHPEVELIKCDSVMFFRPVGQMAAGKRLVEDELLDHEVEEVSLPTGDPIVAILDGLPLTNHALLQDRLIIDDPDNYASAYNIPERAHGTAMASLVVRGDLSDDEPPLARHVYVRPIMKPTPSLESPYPEQIPDDILLVDHIHRAVRRMFEIEGSAEAAAPTIRIINFSIGDPHRPFTQALSPLARLLDWLSVKYGVLFIISAGNHSRRIDTGIPKAKFNALADSDKEASIVRALYRDARHRKIFSPGESINGVTVGALHNDAAVVSHIGQAVNLFQSLLPSPASPFGSGYRRAIKPDLLFNGGRALYRTPLDNTTNASFDVLRVSQGALGNKVASSSAISGELNKTVYLYGTSNAAALTSRMAAVFHDTLLDILEEQSPEIEFNTYLAPLLKAMVIHGCSWGKVGDRLQEILRTPSNARQVRNWISNWLGYGVPDSERVLSCTEQRATLLGFGQLGDGEAHLFNLPLPPSLGARREWRRLTVTLAWLSPVVASTQRYRAASLWFEVPRKDLASDRQNADWNAVRRGTVQHEVFDGHQAVPLTDEDALTIKVNCRKDAGKIDQPVAYGIAVTLEVAEGIDIAIYEEIRTRIASAVEVRARGEI